MTFWMFRNVGGSLPIVIRRPSGSLPSGRRVQDHLGGAAEIGTVHGEQADRARAEYRDAVAGPTSARSVPK